MSAIGTKLTLRDALQCPLSGVKRTSRFDYAMSAFDPKRTSVNDGTMRALTWPRAVALRKELQSLVHSVEAHEA